MKPIDHKNSLDTQQPIVMEAQKINSLAHNLSCIQQPKMKIKNLHKILKLEGLMCKISYSILRKVF